MSKRCVVLFVAAVLAVSACLRAAEAGKETKAASKGPAGEPAARRPHAAHREGPAAPEHRGPSPARTADRRRSRRLTQEQESELLAVLKEHRRQFHNRLIKLRQEDPRAYRRMLRGTWRWYQRWKRMSVKARKASIELQKIRGHLWELTREIREHGQNPQLLSELRKVVAAKFDLDQIIREDRLLQLAKEIERIRQDLKRRSAEREKIVEAQLQRWLQAATRPVRARPKARKPAPATKAGPAPTTRPAK